MEQTLKQKAAIRKKYHLDGLVKDIYEYANRKLNYNNGWDEIAEGWNKEEIISFIETYSITTFDELVNYFQQLISVRKQAEAEHHTLNSTF